MTQWGLDNLFNPGKRHMDDEKRRLQSTREEVGDNSGGRRIDLEGGRVSIAVPRPTDTGTDDTDTDTGGGAADDDGSALDAALEAEDVPAVALANDEAEIVPDLVEDSSVPDDPEPAVDDEVSAPEPVAAAPVEPPEPEPQPEPEPAARPRRSLSANAWSRRG